MVPNILAKFHNQPFIMRRTICRHVFGQTHSRTHTHKTLNVAGSPPKFDTLLASWYPTYMQSFIISHSSCDEQYGDMSSDRLTRTHTNGLLQYHWRDTAFYWVLLFCCRIRGNAFWGVILLGCALANNIMSYLSGGLRESPGLDSVVTVYAVQSWTGLFATVELRHKHAQSRVCTPGFRDTQGCSAYWYLLA